MSQQSNLFGIDVHVNKDMPKDEIWACDRFGKVAYRLRLKNGQLVRIAEAQDETTNDDDTST